MNKLYVLLVVAIILLITTFGYATVHHKKSVLSAVASTTTESVITTEQLKVASSTESILNGRYVNKKYGYSFVIPDGWRVINAPTDQNVYLVKQSLKQEDEKYITPSELWKVHAMLDDTDLEHNRIQNIVDSTIIISVSKVDIPIKFSPFSQPKVSEASHSTFETLKTFDGNDILYRYRTKNNRPEGGRMNFNTNAVLDNGTVANEVSVMIGRTPDENRNPYISDEASRSFLKSFSISTTTQYVVDPTAIFKGHIIKGQSYKKDIGSGLLFKLTPTSGGWSMDIVSNNRGVDDYGFASIATPPFHGTGKNPLEINGEYYGPGDATSGLLKQVSNFIFVLNKQDADIVAATLNDYTSGKTLDFDPKISFFGKGVFRITDLKLEYASSSSAPFIKSMDFEVRLTFPLDIKTNNPLEK